MELTASGNAPDFPEKLSGAPDSLLIPSRKYVEDGNQCTGRKYEAHRINQNLLG